MDKNREKPQLFLASQKVRQILMTPQREKIINLHLENE